MAWTLVVHGGAGLVRRDSLGPAEEASRHATLARALEAGAAVLRAGGAALDATVEAVAVLEDDPQFNAGRGAVYAADGTQQMDASVMRGTDQAAGAVAAVRTLRSPVRAARAVLDHGRHVLMVGEDAERACAALGLETVDPAWFADDRRLAQLARAQAADRVALDHDLDEDPRVGTVGAVALDAHGGLAAATSTGGMANKAAGRVGDSAVIGAGTWADPRVAISATGHGEPFIRAAAAVRVALRLEHLGHPLADAARAVVHDVVPALGGLGGMVAVDADGRTAWPFATAGMYRGRVSADRPPETAIW